MSTVMNLVAFGLRQVVGNFAQVSIEIVAQRLTDHSQKLPKALTKANERAWQALAMALAGKGLLEQVKMWLSPGDDRAFGEQVRLFLQSSPYHFDTASDEFRKKCLAELKRARQTGLLSAKNLTCQDVARHTVSFQRYADLQGMIGGAEQVVARIADDLAEFPNLQRLLRQPTPGGPPLLVAAFAFFFRREVETDQELVNGLHFDGLKHLSASQEQAFEEVGKALGTLGDRFDQVFEQLDRIETVVIETQTFVIQTNSTVLDMQVELQRLGSLHLTSGAEISRLLEEVLRRVNEAGMQRGEVKPHHGYSIRSEEEKQAVEQLLARFRQLPADQQQQVPALLNGLGKLQISSGDFDGARQTFVTVSETVKDTTAQAEAHYNAYRAALEEKKWDEALQAIRQAASLDGRRFAPFPMQRYQPKSILGAGGFGTAFHCHDRNFEEDVVVKTLHADDLDRSMSDVFREAKILRRLKHRAIIGVHECEYAVPETKTRPYIVMGSFPGSSLESHIRQQGPLPVGDLLEVAVQIAQGMEVAHQQGICHRDLKPENILIRYEGEGWQVKIIDFGLALRRWTIETSMAGRSSGHTIFNASVAGTLKYAPPEQMGELPDVKPGPYSDVYAFGKTCCYALFKTTEPKDRHWKLIPDSIRTALKEMLDQCREEELEYRLPSFDKVLIVLQRLHLQSRAEQFLDHGDFDRAIANTTEVIRLDPKYPFAYGVRADAYRKKSDYDRAIVDATDAIRLDPKLARAYFTRAEAYRKKSDYDRAIVDATEAIELDPKLARAYGVRGVAYRKKREYDRAIADLTEAIQLDPQLAPAYSGRGEAYRKKNEYDRAIDDFTEALRLDPSDEWAKQQLEKANRRQSDD